MGKYEERLKRIVRWFGNAKKPYVEAKGQQAFISDCDLDASNVSHAPGYNDVPDLYSEATFDTDREQ